MLTRTPAEAAAVEPEPDAKALATFEHFRTFALLLQAVENTQTTLGELPRKGTARDAADTLRQIIRNAKAIEQHATKLLAANMI